MANGQEYEYGTFTFFFDEIHCCIKRHQEDARVKGATNKKQIYKKKKKKSELLAPIQCLNLGQES